MRMPCLHALFVLCLGSISCSAALQDSAPSPSSKLSGDVRSAMVRGDWKAALELLEQSLAREPDQAELWLYLRGLALDQRGESEPALVAWVELEQRFPASKYATKARFQRAEILRRLGRNAEAEAIWEAQAQRLRSEQRHSELAAIYFELADALSTPAPAGSAETPRIDYAAAYALYARVLELAAPPKDLARARLRMGVCLQAREQWAACAAEALAFLEEFDPARGAKAAGAATLEDVLSVRERLAVAWSKSGQAARARRAFEDLAEDIHAARSGQGPYGESAKTLDAAALARVARLEGDARRGVAETFAVALSQEALLAVDALRRFLQESPDHPGRAGALARIAELDTKHGRTEEALTALETLIALPSAPAATPEEREALVRAQMSAAMSRGRLLMAQKRFEAAIAAFQEYVARYPTGPDWGTAQTLVIECEYQRAADHFERERYVDARAAWNAFLAAHPIDSRTSEIAHSIAQSFLREAERAAEAADEPGKARATELRRAAVDELRKVAQRFPQSDAASRAWLAIGVELEQHLGDLEGAVEAYRRCNFGSAAGDAAQKLEEMTTPSLWLRTEGVWRGAGKPRVHVQARNLETLRLQVYALDLETYFRKHATYRGVEDLDLDLIAPDKSAEVPVAGYRRYAPIEQELELPVDGAGTWVVAVTGGELRATTLVIASAIDVIVKSAPREVFVFAQDVARGEVAGKVRVLVAFEDSTERGLLELESGADGVARKVFEKARDRGAVAALALRGTDVAAVGLEAGAWHVAQPLEPRGLVYTDRPAYRAGQGVLWRAIVREVEAGRDAFTEGALHRVEISDPAGRVLHREGLPLSAFGTLSGALQLDAAAPSGQYEIRVRSPKGSSYEGSFEVRDYQLQKIDLELDFAREVIHRGEPIEGQARAAYYYGEPVCDAPLRLDLPDGTQLEVRTDAHGVAKFTCATRNIASEGRVEVRATLLEENVQRRASVWLAVHEFEARLTASREIVLAGDQVEVEIATSAPDGEPVGRGLSFLLLRREGAPSGAWSEVELARRAVETDAATGLAKERVVLERGGTYVLRVQATDRFGSLVTAQHLVFASGEDDQVRLRLIAADPEVEVGGPVRLQVINRSGPGLALLTLENDGVIEHRVLKLREGTEALELAVPSDAFPRAWVSIARADGRNLRTHSVQLTVSRRLDVTLEALQPIYAPGAKAKLRIKAIDQLGKPAQAEFSLAVVDEALFDLVPDRTPELASVFDPPLRRELQVTTVSSCAFAYEGETETIAFEVLAEARRMRAKAQWEAQKGALGQEFDKLVANEDGREPAQLASIVADTGYEGEVSAFVSRRAGQGGRGSGGLGQGGRGGKATRAPEALPEHETAFWNASVVTGADGTAEVEFDLPGQSTAWRATCRGTTRATLVGEATASFRTRAEFALELRAPAALVEGDRPCIVARVHNLTGAKGTIDLTLRVLAGESTTTLPARVELGDASIVEHVFESLAALPACEWLQLSLAASGPLGGVERSTAVERDIPVRPWGIEDAVAKSGALASDTTLWLELDPGSKWRMRKLQLALAPDLQELLVTEALSASPSADVRLGCWPAPTRADVASRLYGTLRVIELVGASGAAAKTRERLLARARAAAAELIASQQQDGSWIRTLGAGSAHVETTCLALAALARASKSGIDVPPKTLRASIEFLQTAFRNATQQEDELKATITWTLAVAGSGDFAAANRLHRERGSLSPAALAFTTLALLEMERVPMASEVAETLAGSIDAGGRIDVARNQAWNSSSVESLALAAYAIGRAAPKSAKLDAAIEALLGARPWRPERVRGFALAALAWHASATRPARERSVVEVALLGRPPQRIDLAAEQPDTELSFDVPDDAPARVRVDLKLAGGGRPHFTAVLRGFTASIPEREEGNGFGVEQSFLAPPPIYRGREIPIGFGVANPGRTWVNEVRRLPVGKVTTYRVSFTARPRARDDSRSEYLVLEVPLPAGARLLEGATSGPLAASRVEDGTLVIDLGQVQGSDTLEFSLLGVLPGQYRVLPAVLRSANEPARRAFGVVRALDVLERGAISDDPYEPTPDELFHLGLATYEAGDHARAHELLSKLYERYEGTLEELPLRDAAESLLYLSIERDDPRATVRFFEVLKEKDPDLTVPFDEIAAVGAAYRRIDEHERALLIFKATVEETFGRDLRVLGALDGAGDANAALQTFARLLADHPDFASSLEAQLAYSDRLLRLAPNAHEDASLKKAGRTRGSLTLEGVQVLQRFLAMHARDPLAPEAGLNLVNAYLAVEEYERTSRLGRELAAVYTDPHYADAFLYAAAVADWYRGDEQAAQDALQRIAKATYRDASGSEYGSPNASLALYILGQIHHARQEFGTAAEYYERVEGLFADAREALAVIRERRIALPEITTARPGEKVAVTLTYRNVERAEIAVYPVDLMTLYLREKTLANVAGIELAGISPAVRRSLELKKEPQLRPRELPVELDLKRAGAYLVIVRGGELHASGLVLVSDLELEVREDPEVGKLRIQLARRSDARFVRGADVRVVGSQSQRILSGTTDPRGSFVAEGVLGSSTVIARVADHEYAFFRGAQALGASAAAKKAPSGGGESPSYFKNVREQNDASQESRARRLKEEIERDRQGVQIQQVK